MSGCRLVVTYSVQFTADSLQLCWCTNLELQTSNLELETYSENLSLLYFQRTCFDDV